MKLPISARANANLRKLVGYLFSRDIFRGDSSGIVIAGFGNDDIYPHVKSFEIEGVIDNKVKYIERKEGRTGPDNDACIVPFAQEDMIRAFMEGIHPKYYSILFNAPEYLLKGVCNMLLDIEEIKGIGKAKLKSIRSKLDEINKGILDEHQETVRKYREKDHIAPIMNVVAYLPKQELAEMAESFVRLVAFKRRMSVMEAETVGGPIDVAVISKSDGFIWIKRKSYFKQELNPQLNSI